MSRPESLSGRDGLTPALQHAGAALGAILGVLVLTAVVLVTLLLVGWRWVDY